MELDRTARRLLIILFSCFFILAFLPRYEVSAQQIIPRLALAPRQTPATGQTGGTIGGTTGGTTGGGTGNTGGTSGGGTGGTAGGGTGGTGNGGTGGTGGTGNGGTGGNAGNGGAGGQDTSTTTTTSKETSTKNTATDKQTSTTSTSATTPTDKSTQSPPPATTTPVVKTNANGDAVTVFETVTPKGSALTPTNTAAGSNSGSSDSKGLGTGSIVGMAVAGGVALIGIVGFFVWKFTRKRFSDFDDNEAIKWPELNSHGGTGHALPVNNTGRAGFDTGSEVSLSRPPSIGTSNNDPYAVPPLPHLNPNQPYRDDPAAYYDPYHGPVPNTFEPEGSTQWGGEAIPMTQIPPNGGRSRSPGPGVAYDTSAGRRSPGPAAAYDAAPGGRRSPGPQLAYGEPGIPEFSAPQGMTEGPRARSPGPAAALGGGRRSPGPQAAYDTGYGAAR